MGQNFRLKNRINPQVVGREWWIILSLRYYPESLNLSFKDLIFENSFLKNGIFEFWSDAVIVSILTNSSNENEVYYQTMNSKKSLLRIFTKKNRKLSFKFFGKMNESYCYKTRHYVIFELFRFDQSKFRNPTASMLKFISKQNSCLIIYLDLYVGSGFWLFSCPISLYSNSEGTHPGATSSGGLVSTSYILALFENLAKIL